MFDKHLSRLFKQFVIQRNYLIVPIQMAQKIVQDTNTFC